MSLFATRGLALFGILVGCRILFSSIHEPSNSDRHVDARRDPIRLRWHCLFINRVVGNICRYVVHWMKSSTKRQYDRALGLVAVGEPELWRPHRRRQPE
jgi:hypothetical protein